MEPSERKVLLKLIESFSEEKGSEEKVENVPIPPVSKDSIIIDLKQRQAFLRDKHIFRVGDIVQWKEGLKNKRLPELNQICIVMNLLDEPIEEKASGYYEILNIELGFISEDNEFICYHYDSARFKAYTPEPSGIPAAV